MKREQTELNAALEQIKQNNWEIANDILHAHGIEFVSCGDRELKYINLGDTYDVTVCEEDGDFFLSSWGAWYEEVEQEICESEGVIRCGYCGEFTPMDKDSWQEVVCQYCGNLVGG